MPKPDAKDQTPAQRRAERLSESEVFRSMDLFLMQEITRVSEQPVQRARSVRDLQLTRREVDPAR